MNSMRDIFVFACGGKMFMYKANEEKLDVLFDTTSNQYILSSDGKCLYFSENGRLYAYDLISGNKKAMIEGVYNFAISNDERIIVYENQKEKNICSYVLETQENKEIIQLKHNQGSQIFISEDNGYLLFTDYNSSVITNAYKIEVCIYDFASQKISTVYKGRYEDIYRDVIW